ncbi:MAG: DUF3881 family protein [Dorea sp.]
MHKYLTAIGFGNLDSKKKIYEILTEVKDSFSHHELIYAEEELDYCEFQKEYGAGIGIAVFGEMDLDECFEREYYFPYFIGTGVSSYADVIVEKRIDRNAYVAICEDVKIGINLIFHLQNTIEYMKEQRFNLTGIKSNTSVTLSALCNGGTVLLPVKKDAVQVKQQQQEVHNRMMLISAARSGDQNAMESLTLDDIDIYSKVSKRLITEDVFSIVDTYIMPYGVECDRYSILGTILELQKMENEYTGEELYVMKMEVNELQFDLCVPVKRVVGEPAVGRRFKGNIWMQGKINF